jgi:hypothetical protein
VTEAEFPDDVDPVEFVKAVMKISREDSAKVRESTPANRKRPQPADERIED